MGTECDDVTSMVVSHSLTLPKSERAIAKTGRQALGDCASDVGAPQLPGRRCGTAGQSLGTVSGKYKYGISRVHASFDKKDLSASTSLVSRCEEL